MRTMVTMMLFLHTHYNCLLLLHADTMGALASMGATNLIITRRGGCNYYGPNNNTYYSTVLGMDCIDRAR